MKKALLGVPFVMAISTCASAQGSSDPCRLNEATVPKALTLGYSDSLQKDAALKAAWSEWMNAATAVTRAESDAVEPGDIRRRTDAERPTCECQRSRRVGGARSLDQRLNSGGSFFVIERRLTDASQQLRAKFGEDTRAGVCHCEQAQRCTDADRNQRERGAVPNMAF
jgi:hypothetical protein